MTLPVSQYGTDHTQTVIQRCLALGLAVWQCDAEGLLVKDPRAPDSALRWLRTPLIHRWVKSAAGSWSRSSKAQPVELFDGCWLIPIALVNGTRRSGFVMAMHLTGSSVASPSFEAICHSAALEVEEGRRCLEPLLRQNSFDPDELKTVLQWCSDDLTQSSRDATVLEEFSDKLIQSYEETNFLYRLATLLNWSANPIEAIEVTCQQIFEITPFSWIAVRIMKETAVPNLADRLIVAGQLPCPKDTFEQQALKLMRRWKQDNLTVLLTPQDDELAALVVSEVVAERITHDGKLIGGLLAGKKCGPDEEVNSPEIQLLHAASGFLGVFHENLARFEEQRTMFLGTLRALTASVDAKDRYTYGHSERVAQLSAQLAAALDLNSEKVEQVRIAGLVHDVGKIGVPEAVLCKRGRLTDEEFEQIKRHPVIGHDILKDIPPMVDMLPAVLYHHERWDGSGYPQGLRGEQIPLYGRVLGCADTFDAMSSTRSYRPALPREKVLAEFERCAGTQFDPALAKLFVKLDFSEYDKMVASHWSTSTFAA